MPILTDDGVGDRLAGDEVEVRGNRLRAAPHGYTVRKPSAARFGHGHVETTAEVAVGDTPPRSATVSSVIALAATAPRSLNGHRRARGHFESPSVEPGTSATYGEPAGYDAVDVDDEVRRLRVEEADLAVGADLGDDCVGDGLHRRRS